MFASPLRAGEDGRWPVVVAGGGGTPWSGPVGRLVGAAREGSVPVRERRERDGGVTSSGGEFAHLVIDYAKQETLGPIKGLGRFVGFGVAGSVALAVGAVLLLLAVLRALQSETGSTFTGHLSWLPYFMTAALAVAITVLAAWRITKGPAARSAGRDRHDGRR